VKLLGSRFRELRPSAALKRAFGEYIDLDYKQSLANFERVIAKYLFSESIRSTSHGSTSSGNFFPHIEVESSSGTYMFVGSDKEKAYESTFYILEFANVASFRKRLNRMFFAFAIKIHNAFGLPLREVEIKVEAFEDSEGNTGYLQHLVDNFRGTSRDRDGSIIDK